MMKLDELLAEKDLGLNEAAAMIDEIRSNLILQNEETDALAATTFAAQYFLSAVALLAQAEAQLNLAAAFKARELAGNF